MLVRELSENPKGINIIIINIVYIGTPYKGHSLQGTPLNKGHSLQGTLSCSTLFC